MKKGLKALGIITITLVIAIGFSGCGKSQKSIVKSQKSVAQEVNDYDDDQINDHDDNEKIEELKTEDQKIKELINSLPETSLEKLGYKKMNMSNWKTYRNEEFGFEVKYPQSWTFGEWKCDAKKCGFPNDVVEGVVFNAPGDTPGGGTWAVTFLDNTLSTIEKEIKDGGSQFNDKIEERSVIKFQNKDCVLASVISAQNKWVSRNMFCPYQEKIFKIYLDKGGYFRGFEFLK